MLNRSKHVFDKDFQLDVMLSLPRTHFIRDNLSKPFRNPQSPYTHTHVGLYLHAHLERPKITAASYRNKSNVLNRRSPIMALWNSAITPTTQLLYTEVSVNQ